MNKFALIACAFGLSLPGLAFTTSAQAEECSPLVYSGSKSNAVSQKAAIKEVRNDGDASKMVWRTINVPKSWSIGCTFHEMEGRWTYVRQFYGPNADGSTIFPKLTGLGDYCSPTYNVEKYDGYNGPSTKQKSYIVGHISSGMSKKELTIPKSWEPGCTFFEVVSPKVPTMNYYMGPAAPAAPVEVEAKNTETDVQVTISKPTLPAYSREGSSLSRAFDDFSGK